MFNSLLAALFIVPLLIFDAKSQAANCDNGSKLEGSLCVTTSLRYLAGEPITINVYEKLGRVPRTKLDRTFVVVHNNEQKGLHAVKEVLAEKGFYGRLVEVVSNYKPGFKVDDPKNEKRYLYFGDGKSCIDPNRIYSQIGRKAALEESRCSETPIDENTNTAVQKFADELIGIFTNNGKQTFIIGVHNNDEKTSLQINWFANHQPETYSATGIFKVNSHGTNGKAINEILYPDNFVLASNVKLFYQLTGFFATMRPFNIALQDDRGFLIESAGEKKGTVKNYLDDGSMSLYFGAKAIGKTGKPFSYLNIEAGGKDNLESPSKLWQKEIIRKIILKIKT